MHDIRAIRENPAAFDAALARRGLEGWSVEVLRVDAARRQAIKAAEDGSAQLNGLSKQAGAVKAAGTADRSPFWNHASTEVAISSSYQVTCHSSTTGGRALVRWVQEQSPETG